MVNIDRCFVLLVIPPLIALAASAKDARTEVPMVTIEAGTFLMGSRAHEAGRQDDEAQHLLKITHSFAIATTEATQTLYSQVVGTTTAYHFGDDPADLHRFANYCDLSCERAWADSVHHGCAHPRTVCRPASPPGDTTSPKNAQRLPAASNCSSGR